MSEIEKEALAWALFWTYVVAFVIYFVNIPFHQIYVKPVIPLELKK